MTPKGPLALALLVALVTGTACGGRPSSRPDRPLAVAPGTADGGIPWPDVSVPADLQAVATLALDAGGEQLGGPAWVCAAVRLPNGQPVEVDSPVTVGFDGRPPVVIPPGGCVEVAFDGAPGPATLVARWGTQEVRAPVTIVGKHPLQALPGAPEGRVTEGLSDLEAAAADPIRNARFMVMLRPDATRGQLAELLRSHDAALVAASVVGDKAMLSIALAAPADLGALVQKADELRRPFVEVAVPDATRPPGAVDRAPPADPTRPGPRPPPTVVFVGAYSEFLPEPHAEEFLPAPAAGESAASEPEATGGSEAVDPWPDAATEEAADPGPGAEEVDLTVALPGGHLQARATIAADGTVTVRTPGLPDGHGWFDGPGDRTRLTVALYGRTDVLLVGGTFDGRLMVTPAAGPLPDVAALRRQLEARCPFEVTASLPLTLAGGRGATLALPLDRLGNPSLEQGGVSVEGGSAAMSGDTASWKFAGGTLALGEVVEFEPDRGNSFGRDLQLSVLAAAGAGSLTCTFGGEPCAVGRPQVRVAEVDACDLRPVPAGQDLATYAAGAAESGRASAVQPARYALGRPPPPTLVVFRSETGAELTLPAVAVRGLTETGEWPAVLVRDRRGRPGWLALDDGEGATLYALGAYPSAPVSRVDPATLLSDPASIGR